MTTPRFHVNHRSLSVTVPQRSLSVGTGAAATELAPSDQARRLAILQQQQAQRAAILLQQQQTARMHLLQAQAKAQAKVLSAPAPVPAPAPAAPAAPAPAPAAAAASVPAVAPEKKKDLVIAETKETKVSLMPIDLPPTVTIPSTSAFREKVTDQVVQRLKANQLESLISQENLKPIVDSVVSVITGVDIDAFLELIIHIMQQLFQVKTVKKQEGAARILTIELAKGIVDQAYAFAGAPVPKEISCSCASLAPQIFDVNEDAVKGKTLTLASLRAKKELKSKERAKRQKALEEQQKAKTAKSETKAAKATKAPSSNAGGWFCCVCDNDAPPTVTAV